MEFIYLNFEQVNIEHFHLYINFGQYRFQIFVFTIERKIALVSLIIAEQLVDSKGTHRDKGDINARKSVSAAALLMNFDQNAEV